MEDPSTSAPIITEGPPVPPQLSSQLQNALQEILPSSDALDQPEFDAVAYINAAFPDESSLAGNKLDMFLVNLRKQVKTYNDNITRDIREHSCHRTVTKDAINQSTIAITSLFNKMKEIKSKAADSELMVQEICRDIRALDNAKKHLTLTIRALRNLHMLVSAVGQLDYMVAEKQYRDAARLIRAIDDLFSLFVDYRSVEKIRLLEQSVSKTKELCKEQLQHELHRLIPTLQPQTKQRRGGFEEDEQVQDSAFDDDNQQATRSQLNDACQLIEVLDNAFKTSIMLWFSSLLLEDYIALYSAGKEGSSLDAIERRYSWARRMIKNYDDTYQAVFPNEWEMPAFISTQFCKITKGHISKLLSSNPKFDVALMIKGLTKTIDFERELTYNMKMRRAPEDRGVSLSTRDSHEFATEDQTDLVENIKMKYAAKKEVAKNGGVEEPSLFNNATSTTSSSSSNRPKLPPIDFHGSISEAFTPYMGAYIELERKSVDEVLTKIDREEKWNSPEESKAKDRFGGSDDLFLYVKNSINRCSKLTRNQTFYQLYQEYRRGLQLYCDLLDKHLPRKGDGVALSDRELILACYIVNTGEYCNETIPALEGNIRDRIDDPFKEQIDLSSIQENYTQLIHKAVSSLVGGMFNKLNRVLNNMAKADWSNWSSVGDESHFAVDMTRIFKEELPSIARQLSPKFLPFFCNQIASTFIPRYVDTIYKCKRINDMGAQQMSLDASSIKQVLLALPVLATAEDEALNSLANAKPGRRAAGVPRTYTKYVTTEMSKAEALLKTMVAPNERLILTFKALLPKNSNEDLYRIFALRGLKKNEFTPLIDAYNSSVQAEDQIRITGQAGSSTSSSTPFTLSMPKSENKGPTFRNFISQLSS